MPVAGSGLRRAGICLGLFGYRSHISAAHPCAHGHGQAEPSSSQAQHSLRHLTWHLSAGSSFPSPARRHGPRARVGRAGGEVLPAPSCVLRVCGARHRAAQHHHVQVHAPSISLQGGGDSPARQGTPCAPSPQPTAQDRVTPSTLSPTSLSPTAAPPPGRDSPSPDSALLLLSPSVAQDSPSQRQEQHPMAIPPTVPTSWHQTQVQS